MKNFQKGIKAFRVIGIFCATLLAINETRAQCMCASQCVDITARGEFDLAHAVFVGKIVAIENTTPDKNNNYGNQVSATLPLVNLQRV